MFNEDNQDDTTLENDVELEETGEEEQSLKAEQSNEEAKLRAENAKLKAILERNKNKKEIISNKKQSGEFDYGEYAFLAQKGIESDDDIAFVKDAMQDSGKSLRDVLNAKWFKADLEERQALAATSNAVPQGRGAKGTATDSVDYWLSKPLEEVPSDMRIKVVNAKLAKEGSGGVFYNS